MSAILKADNAQTKHAEPSVFHLRDLVGEAEQVIEGARAQATRIIDEARHQAAVLHKHTRAQAYQEGFAEGREAGRQQGAAKAFAEAQVAFETELGHLAKTLGEAIKEASQERRRCLHAAEQDLLSFAIDLAQRVTKFAGASHCEVAQENLRSALPLVMAQSDITVRAHSDDLAALRRFAGQLADELADLPHITFIEDATISRGGVRVGTDTGEIDATLDVQLEQIARALTAGGRE